jgi:hypothetical protein
MQAGIPIGNTDTNMNPPSSTSISSLARVEKSSSAASYTVLGFNMYFHTSPVTSMHVNEHRNNPSRDNTGLLLLCQQHSGVR